MSDSLEERLYDEYLDAVLAGEAEEPEAFCRRCGGDAEVLLPWLEGLASLITDEPTAQDEPHVPAEEGLPWERLGDYRLVRRLGEGGMGVVFLAEQSSLGRLVAVKVVRPEYVGSPTAVERFRREARAIAKLRHDHVVDVYGYGEDGGVYFLAMELVPGRSLGAVIRSAGETPVAVTTLVRWGAEIARALACAHEAGIVHRDVKPSNIRITRDGRAVLLDFGLAKRLDGDEPSLTAAFAGSPAYASPEQLHGRLDKLDGRSDVYSLGVTLYEALAGRLPYSGTSMEELLDALRRTEPPAPRRLNASIPRDLEVVLTKAIEKAPDDRYAGAAELADDLEAVIELRPIAARPPGLAARVHKWVRRNPVAAAACATALVAVVGGLSLLAWQRVEARRADERRAAGLIAEARRHLEDYDAGRRDFEQLRWRVRRRIGSMAARPMSGDDERKLDEDEHAVEEYRLARERSLAEVFRLIKEAGRYDADADGLDGVHAAYYYQKWLDVRTTGREPMADLYADLVEEHDPAGHFTARVRGKTTSTIVTDPPGAEVHVFRYSELGDLPGRRGRRLVPVAPGPEPPVRPGEVVLRVARGAGDVREHDIVLELDAGPVDRGVYVVKGNERIARHDRLAGVDGRHVGDVLDVERTEETGVGEGGRHLYSFRGNDGEYVLEAASAAALGVELAGVEEAVAAGGMRALVWRDGELVRTELAAGIVVRRTAAPMFLSRHSRVGTTPLDGLALEAGWYVSVTRLAGYEDQILPFHVDYPDDPFHESGHADLDARLLPEGTTETGWVYVAADAFATPRPPYWIMEREVTRGEYAEFLGDPKTRAVIGAEGGLVPRRAGTGGGRPRLGEGDGSQRVGAANGDRPVTGISREDALAYAAWMDRRHPQWTHDLPGHDEWVRAGKGGDSRVYVFGDHFRQRWASSLYSAPPDGRVGLVRSCVVDESPFGVFDLSGSVCEWARSKGVHYGGSFTDADVAHFRIGDYRIAPRGTVSPAIGFRLVRRWRGGGDGR